MTHSQRTDRASQARGFRYKRRTGRPGTIIGVAAISLSVHVAALYAADRTDLLQRSRDRSLTVVRPSSQSAEPPERSPESPTCEANATLAAAARLVVCTSPIYDRDECLRATLSSLSLGLTVCNALAMSSEIDLVSPQAVEEIAAEPLLDLLEPEEQAAVEENQIALVTEPAPPTPPPPPPPPPPTARAQVVDTVKPSEEQVPDNTNLLSEYNSKVKEQTVARGAAEELAEKPQPEELTPKEKPREPAVAEVPESPAEKAAKNPDGPEGPGSLMMRKAGESEPAQEAKEKQTAGAERGEKTLPSMTGLEVARGTADTAQDAQKASSGKTGQNGGGGGRPLVPNLIPTKDVLERAIGGGSGDYLPTVKEGETTALNTRKWQYASFFNRIKLRVRQHWHPKEVYTRQDPTGNVFGSKDRTTSLTVTLDRKGKIKAIVVGRKSGVDVLDEEAVRAFRLAQPFPNPPPGLVDPRSGLIVFDFGFYFNVNRRDKWRVFRQR